MSEKKDERKIYTQTGKLGVLNDSLILVYIADNEAHIQLYNTKGEQQRDYILNTKPERKITNVAFGKKSKNIYTISLDDKNYYLTIYRMED